MTTIGQTQPGLLRGILRHLLVLAATEVLLLLLAWFLSRHGVSVLARLFRLRPRAATSPIVDI